MNEFLRKFRAEHPEYDDMSDEALAKALHAKFYSDMSYAEFAGKIGMAVPPEAPEPTLLQRIGGWLQEGSERQGAKLDALAGTSRQEFGNAVAGPMTALVGGQGLQQAVGAIRGLRAAQAASRAPMVPSPSGLVGASGAPLMVRGAPVAGRSAMDALRALASNPWVKRLGLGASGFAANELLKRR